jgi:hypothetical protein
VVIIVGSTPVLEPNNSFRSALWEVVVRARRTDSGSGCGGGGGWESRGEMGSDTGTGSDAEALEGEEGVSAPRRSSPPDEYASSGGSSWSLTCFGSAFVYNLFVK